MEYYEYIEREAEDERRERRQVQRERFLPYGFREPTRDELEAYERTDKLNPIRKAIEP